MGGSLKEGIWGGGSQNQEICDGNPGNWGFGMGSLKNREFGVGFPKKQGIWGGDPPEVEGPFLLPEAAPWNDADAGFLQEPHAEEHVRGLLPLLGIRDGSNGVRKTGNKYKPV